MKNNQGSGRRRAPVFNKGRPLDPKVEAEVKVIIGADAIARDLLIENLHRLHDETGFLSADHLQALARVMGLSMAEVYEVASFYAHFDIVLDGDIPPPPQTIRICDSLSCQMAGAEALLEALPAALETGVRVLRAPCMGRCDHAPVAEIGHRHVEQADVPALLALCNDGDTDPVIPDYQGYDAYVAAGGYALLRACRAGQRTPEQVIEILQASGLRGLGGAGFPAGLKWQSVRQQPSPRLMAINADEGEPGTFKDRHYLESDPHRFLEGMLLAAWAAAAERVYVYVRDEYPGVRQILQRELVILRRQGLIDPPEVILRRGAGAYICGEESAMMESIEGKRGLPRQKPPFPTESGLFGLPTLTHNVETVYWLRDVVEKGADWFTGQGRNGRNGLRSFSVSGRVKSPGVKLAPAGITVRQLIDEYCDGMADGHQFKAYLPGGASGGILPAAKGDIPLDFDTLHGEGCFIGSAAVVILSQADNMKDVALNLMRFFEDESCGQCTPCRLGTEKAVQLMAQDHWDTGLLGELARVMMDASICGLGQAAPNPLLSVIKHFPEEL